MNFNNLIKNLDLLNKLEVNDKIIIKDDKIIIDKNNFTSPIFRSLKKQNRYKTLQFLYDKIFIILIEELNNFIKFFNKDYYNSLQLNIFSKENFFFYLNKLNNLKKSLYNLKLTYNNDILLNDKINNFITKIDKILNTNINVYTNRIIII
jgi:hypothetical protein